MARLPVIVVLCLLFPSAYAQQNTANTAPPAAQSCVACHGAQGQGTGSYPTSPVWARRTSSGSWTPSPAVNASMPS
ncbi:hypothetical protein HML84_19450 [Alcanivorax sp. IO_7]|nr:hypothetical protein HML84_19450 [Alcanivorax sp. IO_7]